MDLRGLLLEEGKGGKEREQEVWDSRKEGNIDREFVTSAKNREF